MEFKTSFFRGDLRQCWQSFYQLNRQPVFVVHLPVPVRRVSTDHIQNLKIDDQKFYAKSKSKATRAKDKTRKQKFMEGKTVCSGFPFFGLEGRRISK